jgi:hypothetical protein
VVRANSLIRAAMDAIDSFELEPGRRRFTVAIRSRSIPTASWTTEE